ncbi:MAG: hypothetical protein E7497_07005 [Ruminococcus sp.]|nr:hypothetical protein [Ruminococcus sp.]
MKRKYIAILAAFAAMTVLAACSDKEKDKASESSVSTHESSAAETSEEAEEETQPDPLDPNRATEAEKEPETEAVTESEEATDDEDATEAETEPQSEVPVDENGAVVIEPEAELSDDELMNAAQTLYENACRVNWNYHVGCPYSLDYESYVENELGWQFFLVTADGVDSVADVEADYFKVFSEKYGSDLSELYIESDGRVYAFDGARGMDIYYEGSQIKSIKERSDGEIVFEVEHSYSGSDILGEGRHTETSEFSAVISEDGTWRAGLFTLPY